MKFKPLLLCWTAGLVVTFCIFALMLQHHMRNKAASWITGHARVISSSLWTLEKSSPTAYLNLAVDANGYDEMAVYDDAGRVFLKISRKEPEGLESFFRSMGLIPVYRLASEIMYENRSIGKIVAAWPCRAIYTCLYVLFCLVLLLLGIGLFLKLLEANRLLEVRVGQRTSELEKEVGQRKRTEKELKSYAQRLALHVLNTPLGVIEWDPEFRVVEWNKSAEQIFGYTRQEALHRKAYDLIVPDSEHDCIHRVWEHLLSQTGGSRSANMNRTKSGATRFCEWYNTPLIHPDGSVMGVASLIQDVTERRQAELEKQRLEAQLLQSQKMEAVGQLAGGIAHDFNNLLQGISGYTQLMIMERKKKGEDCHKLRGIERASSRAAELIRQLLTFSKKFDPHLKRLNLNHAIEQMQEMLERTIPKMIAFEFKLDPELKDIEGDPTQVEQVIMNLAINAMHAMPDGGTITIETANESYGGANCENHVKDRVGPCVVLRISDNGIGMDAETLNRIYEPFFTTKGLGHGTGLGLSIVYGIVKSHRAHIKCSSEPGRGTQFSIRFPVLVNGRAIRKNGEVPEGIPGGTETILLIDDEKAILDIGVQMLTINGYTVVTATNGEEGLQLFRTRQDKIDLVVLDLNMPGMGGHKCMHALKAESPGTKILIASGYTGKSNAERLLDEGANGYIAKPFQFNDFMNKIRVTLDSPQPRADIRYAPSAGLS